MKNTLSLIGDTPLVYLQKTHPDSGVIFAKAEFLQPGGSVKDRAALAIIRTAYESGRLQKGMPVVEMTSGNMGAGLAVVCNVTGNPFVAVMPEGNSQARAKFMRELGAEVILVPQVDGAQGRVTGNDIRAAVGTAMEIVSERRGYYVDQFNNEGSVMAHFNGTGPEIWRDTNGQIDAFVSVVGSAGTFVGTARYLKGKNPAIRCVAVEPFGMEILAGGAMTKTSHVIQGTGYGLVPPHWDPALADDFISITDEEAGEYKDMLCRNEGLYTGFSAAANVCACVKFLRKKEHPADYKVVTLLCDTGFKY